LKTTIDVLIDTLQPDFKEYADNEQFHYWMSYACELDEIRFNNQGDTDALVEYLNKRMRDKLELHPEHHAAVDVATSIESMIPQFAGRFKYD
jgi:hypothetical protein